MTDVYIASPPHLCGTPEKHSRPVGSIWRCDECGTHWHFGYTHDSWGPVWHEVRWWHFRIRRTIRASERQSERLGHRDTNPTTSGAPRAAGAAETTQGQQP